MNRPRSIIRHFYLLSLLLLAGCGGGETTTSGAREATRVSDTFTQLFGRTVSHPRCVSCHAFNEGGISTRQHRGRSSDCQSCHEQEDWRASTPDMTFTNRSPSQICTTTVRRRGGTAALATLLRTSPHVRWGVSEGDIPFSDRRLTLAAPQNQAEWQRLIDRWVAAGSLCQ